IDARSSGGIRALLSAMSAFPTSDALSAVTTFEHASVSSALRIVEILGFLIRSARNRRWYPEGPRRQGGSGAIHVDGHSSIMSYRRARRASRRARRRRRGRGRRGRLHGTCLCLRGRLRIWSAVKARLVVAALCPPNIASICRPLQLYPHIPVILP